VNDTLINNQMRKHCLMHLCVEQITVGCWSHCAAGLVSVRWYHFAMSWCQQASKCSALAALLWRTFSCIL